MSFIAELTLALLTIQEPSAIPTDAAGLGGRVSFERSDASVTELLSMVSRLTGVEIEIQAGLDDPILEHVSAKDALWWESVDGLLEGAGLVGEWDGSVLRVRGREAPGLQIAPEAVKAGLGRVDWETWPSGRDPDLSPRGLSLAQMRNLLRDTIEVGEWFGVPYRACSLGNGTLWISQGDREPLAARWSASLVRPLGTTICRASGGVAPRCLLVRRDEGGGFAGVDIDSGEVRWRFSVSRAERKCPKALAGS